MSASLYRQFSLQSAQDPDIALRMYSREMYFFYHRGFTHSFFGLLFLFPILYFCVKFLFQKAALKVSNVRVAALVLCQLMVSHFFLDYLTGYGVMLLYPFSLERFSYPLMFIIDLVFWAIGAVFFVLAVKYSAKGVQVRRLGVGALSVFVCWWFVELGFKYDAEASYHQKKQNTENSTLVSYPAPFAPLAWSVVERNPVGEKYRQGRVSFFSSLLNPKVATYAIPAEYKVNQFCSGDYSPTAQSAFTKYQTWAEDVACRNYQYQAESGCQCVSLKYGILELDLVYFGTYFIDMAGGASILPPPQLSSRFFW